MLFMVQPMSEYRRVVKGWNNATLPVLSFFQNILFMLEVGFCEIASETALLWRYFNEILTLIP